MEQELFQKRNELFELRKKKKAVEVVEEETKVSDLNSDMEMVPLRRSVKHIEMVEQPENEEGSISTHKTVSMLERVHQLKEELSSASPERHFEVLRCRPWPHLAYSIVYFLCNRIYLLLRLLLFGSYFGYFFLVLVWWVLGAVLQPDKMLPFASMVATFVSFVIAKVGMGCFVLSVQYHFFLCGFAGGMGE